MKKIVTIILCLIFSIPVISQTNNLTWVEIPSGHYTYGPQDSIKLIGYSYQIMKFEVTNQQYVDFLNELNSKQELYISSTSVKGSRPGDEKWDEGIYTYYVYNNNLGTDNIRDIIWDGNKFSIESGYENHPVNYVTWFGAEAFARYYGLRLPTEAEWEKAARSNTGYDYPWGNSITGNNANYKGSGDSQDDGTTSVGFYNGENGTIDSPSPYGIYDMAGNVAEYADNFTKNSGGSHNVCGGGYLHLDVDLRSWFRAVLPYGHYSTVGFRCVNDNGSTTAVNEIDSDKLEFYQLLQNYPNPFNPSTKIEFTIVEENQVKLEVYNVLGKKVVTLVNDELSAGNYIVDFNPVDLSSGIYFYTIRAGDYIETKKMLLVK